MKQYIYTPTIANNAPLSLCIVYLLLLCCIVVVFVVVVVVVIVGFVLVFLSVIVLFISCSSVLIGYRSIVRKYVDTAFVVERRKTVVPIIFIVYVVFSIVLLLVISIRDKNKLPKYKYQYMLTILPRFSIIITSY